MKPRSPARASVSDFFERPATPIGGCGRCSGFEVRPQQSPEHLGRPIDLPELALVVKRLLARPELQDDVERLAGHLAVLTAHAVDVEHRPVARQPARRDAEVEPPLREVVEPGDAIGELRRVVVGQEKTARADADVARLHQRLRDQEIGRRVGLPRRRVVLADPRLGEAELVGPAQHLQVPFLPVEQRALGRMGRHREQSVSHRLLRLTRKSRNRTL